jgi:hypothetical protein
LSKSFSIKSPLFAGFFPDAEHIFAASGKFEFMHYPYKVRKEQKKAPSISAKCLIFLVGGTSFELVTPAV